MGVAAAKARQRLPGKTGWPLALAVLGVILVATAVISREPIVRWLKKHTVGSAAPVTSPGVVAERVHSIAVLPFEPLGQNMDDELLGLGMADAVIGRMSNLKQLIVLPTSAVSKYKGPANDPIAAGRMLGVDAVLSGTIQRSGDRVRATVQLVRVASARTVWSDKFDQAFTDIFNIQDSISDKVARSLIRDFSKGEQKQLSKRYTSNIAAYDSYLMGIYFWNKRSKEGPRESDRLFSERRGPRSRLRAGVCGNGGLLLLAAVLPL
jgi:TolB-like protein